MSSTSKGTERAIGYLTQSPLLRGVSEEILRIMDPPPEMIHIKAGETLIRQGDENTDYFVLVSGRLRVFREENGRVIPIGNILPGEGVGEMALLMNEPSYTTVIARLDSELVCFPQSTFLMLAGDQPLAVLSIARTLVKRTMQLTTAQRKTDYRTIAILPVTSGVDTRALAQALAGKLKSYAPACVVDTEFAGIDELEERFDFIVYVGSEDKQWSRSCLLHADLVFFAVNVMAAPEVSEFERETFARTERSILGRLDLLLIHPDEWRPHCGTAQWLERLTPNEFHHIRWNNPDDLDRLARIATGRTNNLVLSGGGARAFAHIGAVQALKEFRIPIDRIAGVSMGAAVGAMVALASDLEEMADRMKQLFRQRRPGRDLTLPFLSLVAGKKMVSIARDLFGDWRIEDLPTRYFCFSANLADGEIVEHLDGVLWLALRSSNAIPVIAPPLLREGRFLVDGGVLNNLPIDLMRAHFSGSVIAVDASCDQPLTVDHRWDLKCPSGFEILKERFAAIGKKAGLPNILEVLLRTATLASGHQAKKARIHADLLISPPLEAFGLMNFDDFDEIVKIGYESTVQLLQQMDRSTDLLKKFRGQTA